MKLRKHGTGILIIMPKVRQFLEEDRPHLGIQSLLRCYPHQDQTNYPTKVVPPSS